MKKGKYKKIYLSEWISKNETVDDAFNNLVGQRVLFFLRKQDRCLEGIVLDTIHEIIEVPGYEPLTTKTILVEDYGWFRLNSDDPDGNYIIAILEEWPEDVDDNIKKSATEDLKRNHENQFERFRKAIPVQTEPLPWEFPENAPWKKYPTIPQQPIYPHYTPRPYEYPYYPGIQPYCDVWY